MVLSFVAVWIVIGAIAICGDIYMAKHYYSAEYRASMRDDPSNIAAMIFVCMVIGILIIAFQLFYIAATKVRKAYK